MYYRRSGRIADLFPVITGKRYHNQIQNRIRVKKIIPGIATILDMANHGDVRKLEIEGLLNRGEMEVPLGSSEEDFGWHIMEEEKPREADEWDKLFVVSPHINGKQADIR